MKTKWLWTIILLLSLYCQKEIPVISTGKKIRVWLLSRHKPEKIKLQGSGRIFMNNKTFPLDGSIEIFIKNGKLYLKKAGVTEFTQALVESENIKLTFFNKGKSEERIYAGVLEISSLQGTLHLVNETGVESYVASALQSEAGELLATHINEKQKIDFLKAMEIVIRSYALASRGRHDGEGADLCDLTHCIHFNGQGNKMPLSPPVVLFYKKRILPAYFHSTCGGNLTGPEVYWPGTNSDAYRSGSDNKLCRNSPHSRWSFYISNQEMNAITGVKVNKIDLLLKQKRVTNLLIQDGNGKPVTMPVSRFLSSAGKSLGWNAVKSNDFVFHQDSTGFKVSGHGLGHGVGLCQWGAMALAGQEDYTGILSFYYPHAEIAGVEYK